MISLIFRLFLELIFSRAEEYDFKSKHFKPGKVIFAGIVILSLILNFLFISLGFRNGVKYMNLYEEKQVLIQKVADLEKKIPKTAAELVVVPEEK